MSGTMRGDGGGYRPATVAHKVVQHAGMEALSEVELHRERWYDKKVKQIKEK